MAREEKSFEDLVKEAPRGGTVSLVGALAQSSEAGKFVLNLQDGRTMTLETASVKGHTVLGTSVGQTIVRIDVDAASISASAPSATFADINTPPGVDHTLAWLDHGPKPFWQDAPPPYQFPFGGFAPFSLATPHQAPAEALAMMMEPFGLFGGGFTSAFFDRTVFGLDKLLLDGGGGTTPGHPTSDA